MNTRHLAAWLPCIVILAMLASLVTPSPVQAAGEPPPPPGEKSTKAPAASDKPAPPATADTSYTAEIPVAAPLGTPDGAANAAAVALSVDAIAQAGAVLVGPDGSSMSLAASDTVNALLTVGDVYFKGSGPAGSECSGGWCEYDTIAHALNAFLNRNGSGAIFATGGLSEPTGFDVNGLSKLTGLAWDGTTNYTPRLTGGPLTIQNMLKGFSVDGFYISRGINAHDNAGTLRLQNLYVTNPTGTGIFVTNHKGNIDLFNVTVSGATGVGANGTSAYGSGAWLDNSAGAGNITIGSSSFNNNKNAGISVITNGSLLLERVEANGNANWEGAKMWIVGSATLKDSRFNGNLNGSGLWISGLGVITLQNVEARANTWRGVELNTTHNITVNGGSFSNNTDEGLHVSGSGNITLNNVFAQNNATGAVLDNHLSATPKTVTVNNSQFVSNLEEGLIIASKGNVTINHIRAEGNRLGNGITIDNAQLVYGIYTGSGSVSILNTLGTNELIGNTYAALDVKSKGTITVKGVYALGNGKGLRLDGCAIDQNLDPNATHYCLGKGNLSVTATRVLQTSFGNGLDAQVGGAITLDGDTFLENYRDVKLDNHQVNSAKPVTITNSTFSNSPAGGLQITSRGAVTLKGVMADYNEGRALVDNSYGTAAVDISQSSFSHSAWNGGLRVSSAGNITLTSVNASFNHWEGAIIGNTYLDSPTNATITINKSVFDNNGVTGLSVNSKGNLTANNISASFTTGQNNCCGAFLFSLKGNVALLDSLGANQFSFNDQDGLVVFSGHNSPGTWGGTISLSGVTASHNASGYGIQVDNHYATTPKAVTIQKVRADANGTNGLDVLSKGSVTLNNVQANANPNGFGVYIDNCDLVGPTCAGNGNVSILSTLGPNSMSYNQYGMRIDTLGSVAANGVTASYNTGDYYGDSGIGIYNRYQMVLQKPVTITQSSFDGNQGPGLAIFATGVITLNGISASHNSSIDGYGLNLDNSLVPGSPGVNILATLGNNQFNNNTTNGIHIVSSGNIALNKVTANDNGWSPGNYSGAWLQTSGASSISIICSAFNHNGGYGLHVDMGSGVINFKGVAASYNGDYGFMFTSNPAGVTPVVSWTVCGK